MIIHWIFFINHREPHRAWENSRHLATLPQVSPRNHVWETSAEIPYWWRICSLTYVLLLIGSNFVSTNWKVSSLDNIPIFTARWFAVIIKTALSLARVIWGSWTIISCRCTINTSTATCTTAWWSVIMTTDGSQRIAAVCWVFRIWANDPLYEEKASLISQLVSDFKRDLKQRRRRRQRERQKAIGLH